MIISHRHRYLFVEIPYTASTAISRELCQNYNGTSILHKHAPYREFLRSAAKEEREYFVFGGMRNPMDIAVSVFFKQKTNHQGFFTNPEHWRENGGHVSALARRQYQFIQETSCDFATYFKHFYRIPYDTWGSPLPDDFDSVIYFESLQDDFACVLEHLGVERVRPLPQVNKTSGRAPEYQTYYTPEIIERAKWVFGPFMLRWGYALPVTWGDHWGLHASRTGFMLLSYLRRQLMWRRSSSIARSLRWIRRRYFA